MANDSVGKVQLEIEIVSDIQKQVSAQAKAIGNVLKASMEASTKAAFSGINQSMDKTMSRMTSSVKAGANKIGSYLRKAVEVATSALKNVKLPRINFPKPTASKATATPIVASPAQPRAPTSGINADALKAQINNVAATLDNVNARIEFQQQKLVGLKETYNSTFNSVTKNKVQEQILKTEAAINKLIGTSDKLGFKLADLDAKFASLGSAQSTGAVAGMVNETAKMAGTSAGAQKATNGLSAAMKKLGGSTRSAGNSMNSYHMGLANTLNQMFKWMIILPLIVKGLGAMATYVGQSLMTNAQFANSLAQIKTNLMVAFTPIFYAVLPAINALMSALANITAYIAMFTSALFGKTYTQSMQATQGLINAKTAMGYYGDAAKKAGKDSKDALGALAGFDEINQLSVGKNADAGAGAGAGGGGADEPKLVAPSIDTTPTAGITAMAEGLKKVFATLFNPLKSAWAKDGAGVMAALKRAFDGTAFTVKHFFDVLATPSMQLFMENVARLVLAIVKLGLRIYDGFILPIVNWFIDLLPGAADGINPVLEAVTNFVNYLSGDGFIYVQAFLGLLLGWKAVTFVTEMATAAIAVGDFVLGTVIALGKSIISWGANAIAVGAHTIALIANKIALIASTIAVGAWNVICGIATIATTAFGAAVAFLTSPIGLVVLAIVALIAIGVLLYKNWDTISAFLKNCWEGIKTNARNLFNAAVSTIKEAFNGIGVWFSNVFTGAWNGIKNAFSTVGSFFQGVWDTIKSKFTSIGSSIGNAMGDAFKYVVNSIIGFAENSINGFIGAINGAIGAINNIPGVNINTLSPISIPKLARGGIIDQPTLAMVGEAGKEAVVPLENTDFVTTLADAVASAVVSAMLSAMQFSNSGNNNQDQRDVIINLEGTQVGRILKPFLDSENLRTGSPIIKVT